MKKTLTAALILMVGVVNAGWLDELSTAVSGHLSDFKSRFTDDQMINGDIVTQARFREADRGQDTLHYGSGTILIIDAPAGKFLQLASNFTSTPGPDYHVYVSQDVNVDHEDKFDKANQLELGKLIKGSGASYYKIPDGTTFQSVTIWCKAFNEFIMSADFEAPVVIEPKPSDKEG